MPHYPVMATQEPSQQAATAPAPSGCGGLTASGPGAPEPTSPTTPTVETTACPRPLGSIQMLPIADLRPWEQNYRHHPAEQLDRIRESLRRNGQRKAVVVQASTVRIVAGHGVAEAMRLEGYTEARCDVWDCSDEQAAAYLVDDNELSRHAVDDEAALAALLLELQDTQYAPVSFNADELDALLAESMTPGPFPEEFKEVDPTEDDFEHKCPKCGFEWNG